MASGYGQTARGNEFSDPVGVQQRSNQVIARPRRRVSAGAPVCDVGQLRSSKHSIAYLFRLLTHYVIALSIFDTMVASVVLHG